MIEVVFFDLFETLVTMYNPRSASRPSVADRLGLATDAFEAEWRTVRSGRYTGALPDYRDALRNVCRSLRHVPDERVIQDLYEERLALFADACTRTSSEVVELLKHLAGRGVRVRVISNSVPEFVTNWLQSPILPLVQDVVFSHDVGFAKPQPEIYLLACRRASVSPRRAIFVGDGDNNELAGAEHVGIRAYWATWFLDQWPHNGRSASFYETVAPFPRLRTPADLWRIVGSEADGGGSR
jgi:HAD superfamily hydrolase (TIGR01549 family)